MRYASPHTVNDQRKTMLATPLDHRNHARSWCRFLTAVGWLALAGPAASAPREKPLPKAANRPAATSTAPATPTDNQAAIWFARAADRGLAPTGVLLVVSVTDQCLAVVNGGGLLRVYRVSTGRAGVGNRQGSNATPLGWHRVAAWIGGTARPGQVFVARLPVARVLPPAEWSTGGPDDLVLTRILHLQGLEPGLNQGPGIDSHARCIYLHGTNQESLLGQPASHGCIRLSNRDVMELHDLTTGRPTYCWIVDAPMAEI